MNASKNVDDKDDSNDGHRKKSATLYFSSSSFAW